MGAICFDITLSNNHRNPSNSYNALILMVSITENPDSADPCRSSSSLLPGQRTSSFGSCPTQTAYSETGTRQRHWEIWEPN